MSEMPHVEVHILNSHEKTGGAGEPGTPPDRAGGRERALRGDGEAAARSAAEARMRAAPRVMTLLASGIARRRAPSASACARRLPRKAAPARAAGLAAFDTVAEVLQHPALPELSHPRRRASPVRRRAAASRRTSCADPPDMACPACRARRATAPQTRPRAMGRTSRPGRRAGSFRRRVSRWFSSGCLQGSSASA